ncbi:FAD-dependent oxidoreductase [Agrococcus sp. Marseille-Q4369]|uniref:FAD-dependent oxidoreductase n=1 Tax=Agrococcus sp. Marseille-Q4369 TaxID=2810513 RepID=UPI001B8AF683|nr:FAD-dependent oxidoreductase [Agrococcus sp. Marseille-Q4369]QUW18415.1 FAD-dependent oxidoreductase [Agrococcus sp. Marseille-Q4369]
MSEPLRIAVIGAGPAGIYAADILKKAVREAGGDVYIDLFEQLPAPYGLVRYGVAPDHPRIKGIISALREVLEAGVVRLFGNVRFGDDITVADLERLYHGVIFATGATKDAPLDIPGVELSGSYGAADFVSWYDGHPDVPREWPLEAKEIAVIGNGNVALDVARMLVKHPEDLLPTEVPDNVVAGLEASPVTDVHVFGRRGPLGVKFTPLELRELGELRDVDMIVHDEDFGVDPDEETAKQNKQILVISRVLDQWRQREVGTASRRLHLHFWSRPDAVLGDERVEALRVERTRPTPEGLEGTGEYREFPVQAVYRAVGYFSSPLPGVPFDERRGVIPNEAGRVMDGIRPLPGMYATGWIKRGPVGLIGHTKSDAKETIEQLLGDSNSWWSPEPFDPDAVPRLLSERGVEWTDIDGWIRLDEHEMALGEPHGRARVKVVPRDEMVQISRDER